MTYQEKLSSLSTEERERLNTEVESINDTMNRDYAIAHAVDMPGVSFFDQIKIRYNAIRQALDAIIAERDSERRWADQYLAQLQEMQSLKGVADVVRERTQLRQALSEAGGCLKESDKYLTYREEELRFYGMELCTCKSGVHQLAAANSGCRYHTELRSLAAQIDQTAKTLATIETHTTQPTTEAKTMGSINGIQFTDGTATIEQGRYRPVQVHTAYGVGAPVKILQGNDIVYLDRSSLPELVRVVQAIIDSRSSEHHTIETHTATEQAPIEPKAPALVGCRDCGEESTPIARYGKILCGKCFSENVADITPDSTATEQATAGESSV